MSLAKIVLHGIALAGAGALISCNQADAPNHRTAGSYTAARHMRVGSNIPQPDGADSIDSVAGADQSAIARQTASRQTTMIGGNPR